MDRTLDYIGYFKDKYSNEDLMNMMGCSEKTIRKYRKDGLLPFSSWNKGKIYYTPNDIIVFLRNTCCDSSQWS